MLPITTCTVTMNNGKLLKYSIESIVNYVSEIFIFDDSTNEFDRNIYLNELDKYENVTIFRTKHYGKDLGKKKQFLVDKASNDIVMRWDDDFILYNKFLLEYIYYELSNSELDTIITQNWNIAFTFEYTSMNHKYCEEIYIYKKNSIIFGKKYGYCDFPNKVKTNTIHLNRCLFLHMWNFKSYENMAFREYMSQYLCDDDYYNYYEYCYVNLFPNQKYNYNDIIKYKRDKNYEYSNCRYNFKKDATEITKQLNDNFINREFFDYISSNYKIKNIFAKNSKMFKYDTIETYNLVNLCYTKDGNIGNMINFYIFEKLCGFRHKHVTGSETHFLLNSNINENTHNSLVWGSGICDKNRTTVFSNNVTRISDPVIMYSKLFCVRGPYTKELIKNNYLVNIPYYGHPLLIVSLLYQFVSKPLYNIGIVLNNFSAKKLEIDDNIKHITTKGDFTSFKKIELFIHSLLECKFIMTNVLDVMALCHSYQIPCVFINEYTFDSEFSIKDYFYSMYKEGDLCRTHYKGNNLIKYAKTIQSSYIKPDYLKERQRDLIISCPFIDEGLKPLLLKMV